jgi:hypothetical protein
MGRSIAEDDWELTSCKSFVNKIKRLGYWSTLRGIDAIKKWQKVIIK